MYDCMYCTIKSNCVCSVCYMFTMRDNEVSEMTGLRRMGTQCYDGCMTEHGGGRLISQN